MKLMKNILLALIVLLSINTAYAEYENEIYTRKQGDDEFKFYVKDKKLIGEFIHEGIIKQLPISNDIPDDFQTNLDEEKIMKIKYMLERCYFKVQGAKILVNARGLGGWGEDVHKGYSDTNEIYYSNGTFNKNYLYNNFGTFQIAHKVGFSVKDAMTIADANYAVDTKDWGWNKALKTFIIDNERHFAGNSWDTWLTSSDPRYEYAFKERAKAIIYLSPPFCGWKYTEGLEALGRGLHALQDAFSHNPSSITCLYENMLCWHDSKADDVNYIPLRITYTMRATELYLSLTTDFNDIDNLLSEARSYLPKSCGENKNRKNNNSSCTIL